MENRFAQQDTEATLRIIGPVEIVSVEANTRMVRNGDGTYSPVADDDPRAESAQFRLMHDFLAVNGQRCFVHPGYSIPE